MLSSKNVIFSLGYLVIAGNTIATNNLPLNSNIELGEKVYHDRCKACHGARGDGKTFAANALFPLPKNFTTEISKEELTQERMIHSVTKGRPNTAMMPWKNILSEQEIRSVVSYIRQELMRLKE